MATEEQTDITGLWSNIDVDDWYGQRLTISNRLVTKLSMPFSDNGGNGDLILEIRKVSDNSIIVTKTWGLVSLLADSPTIEWAEVTFDTPVIINEEVRLVARTTGAVTGCLIYYLNDDTKANECQTVYSAASWTDHEGREACYIYTYEVGWTGKISGVTNPAKVMGVDVANIASVKGVA